MRRLIRGASNSSSEKRVASHELPIRSSKIRLFQPSVGIDDLEGLKDCFDKAWLGLGDKVAEFEEKWSQQFNCKHSIACNSATAALQISLLVHNFPEGSEVIVPSLTFASTASVVLYSGLKPVFADIDSYSMTLDVKHISGLISEKTVAIIPVHYGGEPCEMEAILNIANEHNLIVIEDCAHTQGGVYKDKYLGTWGNIGCFSFEEKKGMTTGDGGMIVTNNGDIADLARKFRWLGINKDTWSRENSNELMYWYYEIKELGYKYNMNNLAASLGLSQFKKLSKINKRKTEIIKTYLNFLKDCTNFSPLLPYSLIHSNESSYWLFGVRCSRRNELMDYLNKMNISYGMHFTPLNEQPLFKNQNVNTTPVASQLSKEILTLPLHAELTEEEINYVGNCLICFDSKFR